MRISVFDGNLSRSWVSSNKPPQIMQSNKILKQYSFEFIVSYFSSVSLYPSVLCVPISAAGFSPIFHSPAVLWKMLCNCSNRLGEYQPSEYNWSAIYLLYMAFVFLAPQNLSLQIVFALYVCFLHAVLVVIIHFSWAPYIKNICVCVCVVYTFPHSNLPDYKWMQIS